MRLRSAQNFARYAMAGALVVVSAWCLKLSSEVQRLRKTMEISVRQADVLSLKHYLVYTSEPEDKRNAFPDYKEYLNSESGLVRGKTAQILASIPADDRDEREQALIKAFERETDPEAFLYFCQALINFDKQNWANIKQTAERHRGSTLYKMFKETEPAFLKQIENWDKIRQEVK